jgi:class 3 adenylate cyclase/tetratricopeptide (TPR) repeat protein
MVACPSCGVANRAAAKFCNECGAALALSCPACGAANEAGAKFCDECGAPLASMVAAPAAPAPEPLVAAAAAERRLVSVLFADLVGFTSLSESRDAEDVRDLLSRYFDTCRRLVELYGGTVEKFIGDAVMAVWGTPAATEDDAERAVRAALDLVAAVSALGDEVGASELRARAGVLTGEAAVNLAAVGEGMVAGDLVNTASRVQSVAEPGSVFVGEATRRASERAVVYEAAGSFELKGKEGETPLWRALRVVSGRGGSLKSEGLEAPFVGRDRELRQIKDLFHVCAQEGRAQLVSVTGIAGIGKSRLAWEFYKYFDGLAETIYWHRGRCLSYGEGVTYWALADMVRMRCRIAEDDAPEVALGKLQAALAEHILDAGERRSVEPKLAQLLGLGGQEMPDRQELFAAWRLFFERLAEAYPCLLVFEDVHWADASLLDFVEYLLEWSRNHPLFVVTLARPELLERRPTWGAGHRNFTSLYLEPLSEEAMGELLTGLVPGLPVSLRSQILARAEGVPLYAVETVRMLLDRGLLVHEGSVYRPTGEIAALEVPETLHALVAARLDGLSPQERRLVQDAAVLGKTFAPGLLAALTGLDQSALEPLLTGLVRKELLGLQSDPRSPEHGQYGFLQDIVRHVAYETLAKRERRAKHLAAAEHLAASLGEEEVAEVVASHLLDAYRLDPDAADAVPVRAQARAALLRAGERAESLAAAGEAQRYFQQAAELTDDLLARAELVGRAGRMAWRAGNPADARPLLEQAHAALAERDDPRAAGPAVVLADIDFAEGHPDLAVARLEPVLEALEQGAPPAELAAAAAQLGRLYIFGGELERAAQCLDRALALAEAHELTETLVQALNSKAVIALRSDRLHEARILLEGALELALAHDLATAALRVYNNLAVVLDHADLPTSNQLEHAERALELARRAGERSWEWTFLIGRGGSLAVAGRWDEALRDAAEIEQTAETEFAQGLALGLAAPIHCERGAPEKARQLLTRHAAIAESGNPDFVVGYKITEARVVLAEGRSSEALAIAEDLLAGPRSTGTTSWNFKTALTEALTAAAACGDTDTTRRLLAMLDELPPGQLTPYLRAVRARFRAQIDPEEADGLFAHAAQTLAGLERPFDRAVVQLEHGEWLTAQGRAQDAEPLLGEARETFERLEAKPWLERLEVTRTGAPAEITA